MRRTHLVALAAVLGLGASAPRPARLSRPAPLPEIAFQDNTERAGRMVAGELVVALEVRRGMWRPNGPDHPGTAMLAFAEVGRPTMLPGPMLRAPLGTKLRVSVHNTTDSTITVHGLRSYAGANDSLVVAAGETRETRFVADAQGDHYYWGTLRGDALLAQRVEDGHLAGALIVDPPGVRDARDHVVLVTISTHSRDSTGALSNDEEIYAFNGRPWPLTQRITGTVGDTMRFRIINASYDVHPIHLHGTYFRVEARGDGQRDTLYAPRDQRMAVTELMMPGTTMTMAWAPEQPGTWLLHCHLTYHTVQNPGFGVDSMSPEEFGNHIVSGHVGHDPNHHVEHGMGGLLMAISVPPPPGWKLSTARRRTLRFVIPNDSTPGDSVRFFTPTWSEGTHAMAPVTRGGPGAPIVLHVGEPTTIRVVNQSPDATAIHWHGLQIESVYDGVVGLGGTPDHMTPAVMPRDSFDARMTPPRAGTFIYHTHFLELRQTTGGLYGALIVLPAGQELDGARDHVVVIGVVRRLGTTLNGAKTPPPIEIEAGVPQRFRFINITVGNPAVRLQLLRPDSSVAQWTQLAKDGADLPDSQRRTTPARQRVSIGETYDVGVTADTPGDLRLELRSGAGRLMAMQAIRVVARRQ